MWHLKVGYFEGSWSDGHGKYWFKREFSRKSMSRGRLDTLYANTFAVTIRWPNMDSIFFSPAISLLAYHSLRVHTAHSQYTKEIKNRTQHRAHTHTSTQASSTTPINKPQLKWIHSAQTYKRTGWNPKGKRPVDTSRRIIFFIAVGLVVNMGVALRLVKPIENGTVRKNKSFDCGAGRTQWTWRLQTNEQNEIAVMLNSSRTKQ